MKKVLLVVLALAFMSGLAFAQPAEMTMKGVIIDNMCAGAHKADITEFVKTHTKDCALMPQCVASGYSIVTDGKVMKFDKASNAKIEEFLKKADSKLGVEVVVKKTGEELSLVSIMNQK